MSTHNVCLYTEIWKIIPTQGKSSIAPIFSKRGFNYRQIPTLSVLLVYTVHHLEMVENACLVFKIHLMVASENAFSWIMFSL